MNEYHELLKELISLKRNSKLVSKQLNFDLKKGIPNLSSYKKLLEERIVHLVNFFKMDFSFSSNSHQLLSEDLRINSAMDGTFIDQLEEVILGIRENPEGQTHKLHSFHPDNSYPLLVQFSVDKGFLNCIATINKSNLVTQIPLDLIDLSVLTMTIAQLCSLDLGNLSVNIGEAYTNIRSREETFSVAVLKLEKSLLNTKLIDINEVEVSDFLVKS